MLQTNRPRGIIQNKNAANVQFNGPCLQPTKVSLQSVNHLNDNVIEKPHLRQQQEIIKGAGRQVDTENIITLASLQSVNETTKGKNTITQLIGGNGDDNLFKADPKKVSILENFDKGHLNNIQLTGQSSPTKHPTPPKLKSRELNHDRQQPASQAQRQSQVEPTIPNKIQQTSTIANDEFDFNPPKNASALSRIPRLSLRFSNAPCIAKPNLSNKQQQLNKAVNVTRPKSTSLANQLNDVKSKSILAQAIKENDELDHEEDEPIEDIDNSNSRDAIFLVCDVAKDIYDYMYSLERVQEVRQDYLKDQRILTPKVRQRLINWCIEINSQLKLLPETLYITVAIIDRFFDKFVVEQQSQVQLFASAATLIASKYEEIYPPEIRDLVYLSQNCYTKRDIVKAEMFVLKTLEFDLGKPIPLAFLRRFSKAAHCNLKMHSVAKYLMELSLTEYECCHWHPSLLAAASLFTSLFLVAACKTDSSSAAVVGGGSASGLLRTMSSRRSVAPLSLSSQTNRLATQSTSGGFQQQSSVSSSSRITRSRLSSSNSYVAKIVDSTWTKQMVHYTRYTKDQLHGPASILCKVLKRSQKNPQSFYSVKKNIQDASKWLELKSSKVDDLMLMSGTDCKGL